MNYGFVIDTRSCIGCHACSTACKSENQVPVGVHRTWVKTVEKGRYPDVTRLFQVTRCNHCANPPCVRICPVTAMYQRDDGIVEFDPDVCIGCKACIQACPYDAIYVDPDTHTVAKCHFCGHRVDVGLEPACVVVCPEHAILAGDLDDPHSEVARAVATHPVTVRKPEQGTSPKVFYIDGDSVVLHPSAAEPGASFAFAEVVHPAEPAPALPRPKGRSFSGSMIRQPDAQGAPSGGPVQMGGVMAGHMVQVGWNAQHHEAWHWPIPAYLVTKAAAAGLFLGVAPMALAGSDPSGLAVLGGALVVVLMLVTTALLIYDLERPERFGYLLARPQWKSWVARAAWILTGFSVLSGLWWACEAAWLLGLFEPGMLRWALAVPALPLAALTGTYTAFLFAQAEGRDFWQSPVSLVHMALQTVYLGAIATLLIGGLTGADVGAARGIGLGALLLAFVALCAELLVPRASEIATRAQRDVAFGAFAGHTWLGGALVGLGVPVLCLLVAPTWLSLFALLAAGGGMFAYELAYVTAPQRIPNS